MIDCTVFTRANRDTTAPGYPLFELHPQLSGDTLKIGDLPLSRVLLMNERQFPWLILVPRRTGITEIHQLDETDRAQLASESHQLSVALMAHFQGDKLNIGALGNLVPQLHIHHIVRFTTDAAWPMPVWGNFSSAPYDDRQLRQTVADLQHVLAL